MSESHHYSRALRKILFKVVKEIDKDVDEDETESEEDSEKTDSGDVIMEEVPRQKYKPTHYHSTKTS